MATGALDANGIWQYGEDDSETTFSGLLNKLASSTSDTVTRLEGFTGYTGTLAVANGGTGATTVANAQNSLRVGLVPISPTSVAATVGTVTVNTLGKATFTGCQFMTLNGVFSSAYQSYLIQANFGAANSASMWLRLRASGTDATASNYVNGGSGSYETGAITGFSTGATSGFQFNQVAANGAYLWTTNMHIHNPAVAMDTTYQSLSMGYSAASGIGAITVAGRHSVSTAYDGFSIFIASGTAIGTIQVFGYND